MLVWLTSVSIYDPLDRLALYTALFDAGQREDIARYVNRELLVRDWPLVRRLTARELIEIWEECLPRWLRPDPGPAWINYTGGWPALL